MKVTRGGDEQTLTVKLGERPNATQQQQQQQPQQPQQPENFGGGW